MSAISRPGAQPSSTIVVHPNRDKPRVQATRATVVLLLLASVALVLLITIGGSKVLQGAVIVPFGYVLVYLLLAFYAARWNRGTLPVAAALALLLAIFALVSAPAWFEREKTGLVQASLGSDLLGVVTLLLIPVQILLIAFAMRGLSQGWNVEVERAGATDHADSRYQDAHPHPA
jgi:presenilin-like A22 family membrane protease